MKTFRKVGQDARFARLTRSTSLSYIGSSHLLPISLKRRRDNPILTNPKPWHSGLIHRMSVFTHGISIVIISDHRGGLLSNS
jgi:hypothetical protein